MGGDNLTKVNQTERMTIAGLVQESLTRETCLPSNTTMEKQQVPEKYRLARNINNVMPFQFVVALGAVMLCYGATMCALHTFLLKSSRFDKMERKHSDRRTNQRESTRWQSPPTAGVSWADSSWADS